MIINIITLFPCFFDSPFKTGLLGKAIESGIITINLINPRDFSDDKFNRCDDYPYGGGSGMVLNAEPLFKAIESLNRDGNRIIFTTPGGKPLDQEYVKELKSEKEITLLCGHYEGIDERVVDKYVDDEISTGDYILSGGEFASLIIVDAVSRYIPGFMSNKESLTEESFEDNLLEHPQYTRPDKVSGKKVPDVLLTGNHNKILSWRLKKRIKKTKQVRPDLYKKYLLKKILGE